MTDGNLLASIQQRHVVRAAAAHIIVGWLLVQFADVVMPYLGIVDEPVRWAFVVSVATFPVTLLLAWILERPWQVLSSGRTATEVLGLFAVALFAWAWAYQNLPESAQARTRIAILPFAHSGDSREESLSRAIGYEVSSLLLRSRALDVIGFSSANSPLLEGLTQPRIAERLNAGHLLAGAVSVSGDQMMVEIELLDSSGEPIWQSEIEDDVENLFEVQEQIATLVERRLGYGDDRLAISEIAANRCWKPSDPVALAKYYTARYWVELRTDTEASAQQIRDAIQNYEELIEAWPEFAEARSALAWALSHQAVYDRRSALPAEVREPRVRELAERALADCPTLGEALHLLPNQYDHPNHWIGQHRQLTAFIRMQPEMEEYYQRLARHYSETGLLGRALDVAEQNLSMNPLSVRAMKNLGSLLQRGNDVDDFERAIELFDRAAELGSSGPNFPRMTKAMLDCGDDLDCFYANKPPPIPLSADDIQIIYRVPDSDATAKAATDHALDRFREHPDWLVNWFVGGACNFEHLRPLSMLLWDEVQALWKVNGPNNPYWHWPNVWCDNIKTHPEFPRLAADAGLIEYWNEVEFPSGCRANGASVACSAVEN